VYFTEYDNKIIILLFGGSKDTQNKDIALARDLLQEFKSGVQNAKSSI
jgi:putative addiction module killer protein